jgi:predicted DNA-binding transcriptional regulator AlpA
VLTVTADTLWLRAEDAGRMLGYDGQVFRERIAVRPGFPRPLRIGGKGAPRWNARELHEWAFAEREKTGGRKRAA